MIWKLRTWYKLHKWFSIFAGIALIIWLVSGILIVILPVSLYQATITPRSRPDYLLFAQPAAEVVADFMTTNGLDADVSTVELRLVGDEPVYRVTFVNGENYLLQATTGDLTSVNAESVAAIANANLATDLPITQVDYLEHHTINYLYGELPTYRVKLDDARTHHLYISPETGQIVARPFSARLLLLIESFHTFAIFHALRIHAEQAVAILLWGSILVTTIAVLFGYYLALPHRRRTRSRQDGTTYKNWLQKIRNWYALHRWLSIVTGLALLMWLVTGITMTWHLVFAPLSPPATALDYEKIVRSPAEVVESVPTFAEPPVDVRGLSLKPLFDSVVYQVRLADNRRYLVDATTGELVTVPEEMAARLVQAHRETETAVALERITAHSAAYPYGPIPVYRATFPGAAGIHVYVDALNADTWQNNRWDRARILLGSIHTFDALRFFLNKQRLIKLLITGTAGLALVTAVTGYYLALPYRWQLFTRRRRN